MSVASEITRLQNAKADLKTAIEGKGVTVSADAKLDAYPALVESIQQGGGGDGVYKYVSLSGMGTTQDNPYIVQIDDVPTCIEVREKNSFNEYFCFERVSNGKRSAVFEINDEVMIFYKQTTAISINAINRVNSTITINFN